MTGKKIRFCIRQAVKLMCQRILMPLLYRMACLRHPVVDVKKIVFADAHHSELPDSMAALAAEMRSRGYLVEEEILDYQRSSSVQVLKHILRFMDLYAGAGTVVLCDYFLPAVSCRKRKQTKLIQLWHACGYFKKFGYTAEEDIPKVFPRNMFDNFDLVTVSSEECVPRYAEAFHLPEERVKALGISRTDKYYDPEYVRSCRRKVEERYPEAVGRKILLWAPTFRGNAALAGLTGYDEIRQLAESLGDEWFPVIKLHPHMEGKCQVPHTDLPIEILLPAADAMISDFSSVVFEFSIFGRPMFLYAPDAEEYETARGLFPEAQKAAVQTGPERIRDILLSYGKGGGRQSSGTEEALEQFCRRQMSACDGQSTRRIADWIGKRS